MKKQKSPKSSFVKLDQKLLSDEQWLKKELASGKTAQEILDISDEEVDEYYDAAQLFFEKEKYTDAFETYHFLVTLNPMINEYWLGLAMSAQMCGDFEGALDAYEMVSFNLVDSPVPYLFLAKCLLVAQDYENAQLALDLAVELSGGKAEFADVKSQAIQARKQFQSVE